MERKFTNDINWWDKLGKPQYGGELVIRADRNITNFDPYFGDKSANINSAWMEKLHTDCWTLSPEVFDNKTCWHPCQYQKGQLAENWEFTDPGTIVFHLRKGIHWQDKPPANGREFTADDVVFHFNRLCGLGGGFNKPSPLRSVAFQDLISVTAIDVYTVVFKWRTPDTEFIVETLLGPDLALWLENPDAIKKWGDIRDWHHAIGIGSFILEDVANNRSATLVKNPNYWGYDERYPKNKLPYLDVVKYIVIPDIEAALAAMRTGNIDVIDGVSFKHAQAMQKTNPEILQIFTPLPPTFTLDPRNDRMPFNDIRVRKAMQMAIDLPTIAKSYYQNTVEPYPDTLTSRYMKGWGFPYDEWPQDLKTEYAYNPTSSKKLLADAGYSNGFKTNIVVDSTADIDLLQIVKYYFTQVGIDMEIRVMETPAWSAFVRMGHRYDQMVHAPTGLFGHTAPPIEQLSRLQTGSYNNYGMINDPVCAGFFGKAKSAANQEEVLQILREANEYIARRHFSISLLQVMTYSLCQPWVKGFDAQFGSTWGVAGGPLMLSFYLGRFWIDQDLKRSIRY
jgi:peptide/nickel transport system substrate-binding protein